MGVLTDCYGPLRQIIREAATDAQPLSPRRAEMLDHFLALMESQTLQLEERAENGAEAEKAVKIMLAHGIQVFTPRHLDDPKIQPFPIVPRPRSAEA